MQRLRIAIQKKGRLNSDSLDLLSRCGLKLSVSSKSLVARCQNLDIDILLVRDDDIPTMVMDGICDLGIVGENELYEKALYQQHNDYSADYDLIMKLGFGRCRLAMAFPEEKSYTGVSSLTGLRIATSYPELLRRYLKQNNVDAEVLSISGSVEIAPQLGMADLICDLVSTGRTLEQNKLKEVEAIIDSQAVLIQAKQSLSTDKQSLVDLLMRRMQGVLSAQESKYILFHAPRAALEAIKAILPGCETPTILPLDGYDDKVAVHLVSAEAVFWDTLEKLKQAGASSILVLPIEKMLN